MNSKTVDSEKTDGAVRDLLGATIEVLAGKTRRLRRVATDGSYGSASDPRVLVGLGDAPSAGTVTVRVRRPGGAAQTWEDVPVGRYTTLTWEVTPPKSPPPS